MNDKVGGTFPRRGRFSSWPNSAKKEFRSNAAALALTQRAKRLTSNLDSGFSADKMPQGRQPPYAIAHDL